MTTKKAWPAAAAGGFAAALGVIAMGGWHAERMDLVRMLPSAMPMQYDAAVCLLLCGAGLAALALGRRRPALALGAATSALAAWSILRALMGVDFGLERLLGDAALRNAVPGSLRMEPLAALAFLFAGGLLAAHSSSTRRSLAATTLLTGAVLAAFGSMVFLCHVGGIAAAFGWEHLTRVAPQTGLGFAAIGAGFLLQFWPRTGSDAKDSRWLPIAAGLGAATATLFLWTALHAEEHVRIQYHVDVAMFELAGKIQALQAPGRKSGDLRPEQLFGMILNGKTPSPCAFAVYLGRKPIYTSPGAPDPRPEEYARNVAVRLGGEDGWVRLWPSADLLAVEHSRLPASVGAVGLILAFLLGWSVHLSQLARRQAREIAAASAAKSRFLANISREFGNPLNSIVGFSEILLRRQDGELNSEQEKDLRAVHDGGRRLASLMKELMELARLEAGKLHISLKPLAAREIVEDLRRYFTAEAGLKDLALRVELGARDGMIRADPERLRQALACLVANAIKFTDHGEVALGLQVDDEDVVFRVWDSGPGIPVEEKSRIFEPFWQSRRLDGVKKTEGLGLGLFLAKRLVELQGGALSVELAAGNGTAFSVRLPRVSPAESGRQQI
ncbi:MAG TPA: HAMP domain-containing sensor histidine kinase [Elusimicrobiota bacterium]|nr:HAMP domain-containing sensor histidine kinase [Elusimicrobiota bacterium]